MQPGELQSAVERAIVLYEREVALREAGRAAELTPGNREAAESHFRRASRLHRMRLGLLRRCGVL